MSPAEPAGAERVDVAVIGGGPAGSAAARRLARRGLHVVQLERRIFGAPENDRWRSGEGALPVTLNALRRLGVSLDWQEWSPHTANGAHIRWPNGQVTIDRFPPGRHIHTLDRERFDAALWREGLEAGVDARLGWTVERLLVDSETVTGLLARDPDGKHLELHTRLVIDAGGRNAPSLRQFGLRRAERGDDFVVVVLFFDHVPELQDDLWEMHFFDRACPAVAQGARIADGLVRFGLGANLHLKLGSGLTPEEFFWRRLGSYPELEARLRAGRVVQPPYARARLGYRTTTLARDGLLLIGDAAGYLNPILGDGILMALCSAEIASEVAADAFDRGDFTKITLAQYERRWRRARWSRLALARALIAAHRYPALIDRLGHIAALRRLMIHALTRP
jgi:flavin-dependent dehydrogenase